MLAWLRRSIACGQQGLYSIHGSRGRGLVAGRCWSASRAAGVAGRRTAAGGSGDEVRQVLSAGSGHECGPREADLGWLEPRDAAATGGPDPEINGGGIARGQRLDITLG